MPTKKYFFLFFVALISFSSYAQETDGYRFRNAELLFRLKFMGLPFWHERYTVSVASGGVEFRIRERFSVMSEYVYYNWNIKDTYTSSVDLNEHETHQKRSQYYTAMEYRFYPLMLNLPDENGQPGSKMYFAANHKFGRRIINTDAHFDLMKNGLKSLDARFNEFNLLVGFQTAGRIGLDLSCGLGWRLEKRFSTIYNGELLPDSYTYSLAQRPSFVVRWSVFFNLTKDK